MITMAAYIIYFKPYNYAKHLILSNYIKTKIHQKDFFGLSWNHIINLRRKKRKNEKLFHRWIKVKVKVAVGLTEAKSKSCACDALPTVAE